MQTATKCPPFELLISEHENGGFTLEGRNPRHYGENGARLGAFTCPRQLLDHLEGLLIPAPAVEPETLETMVRRVVAEDVAPEVKIIARATRTPAK